MTQVPPTWPNYADGTPRAYARPHRGGAVLALGILGLVVCFILGIIAWAMGNGDLREMEEGAMDPSGRSLTQAGRICGMISVILACAGVAILILLMALGFFTAAATAVAT